MLKNQTFPETILYPRFKQQHEILSIFRQMRNYYAKNCNISKIKGKQNVFDQILELFPAFSSKRKDLHVNTNLPTNTNAIYDLSIKHTII